jgi:hypothetical protein
MEEEFKTKRIEKIEREGGRKKKENDKDIDKWNE